MSQNQSRSAASQPAANQSGSSQSSPKRGVKRRLITQDDSSDEEGDNDTDPFHLLSDDEGTKVSDNEKNSKPQTVSQSSPKRFQNSNSIQHASCSSSRNSEGSQSHPPLSQNHSRSAPSQPAASQSGSSQSSPKRGVKRRLIIQDDSSDEEGDNDTDPFHLLSDDEGTKVSDNEKNSKPQTVSQSSPKRFQNSNSIQHASCSSSRNSEGSQSHPPLSQNHSRSAPSQPAASQSGSSQSSPKRGVKRRLIIQDDSSDEEGDNDTDPFHLLSDDEGTKVSDNEKNSKPQTASQSSPKRGVKRRLVIQDDSSDEEGDNNTNPFHLLSDDEGTKVSDNEKNSNSIQHASCSSRNRCSTSSSRCSPSASAVSDSCNTDSDESTEYPALQKANVGKEVGKGSKKHCCMYCEKFNTKMSTHLQRVHKDEVQVAQILALKKGDPKRRQAFIQLQDQGDFNHNVRVLSNKQKGSQEANLILKYQQQKSNRAQSDYLACPHCKALYQKHFLSRHETRCAQKVDGKKMKRGQCSFVGRMLLPLPENVSEGFFKAVIARMRDDDIARIVKGDSLILKYGERVFMRRDTEEHTSAQVSSRLRELARLVQVLRQNTHMNISRLSQALDPEHFDVLIAAVRSLGQYSGSSNMCKKGSLVLKVGHSLRKCNQIARAEAIKNNDKESLDKSQRFESLFESDWFDRVSASANQSVQRARMNKPKLLPSLDDVEKVNLLVEKDLKSEDYPVLAKAVLVSVTVFNRKRGGEVQRMKVKDFEKVRNSKMSTPDPLVLQNLTASEKKLVKVLHRVEIRGKFNRPVPILLTPLMVESIKRLLAIRGLLGLVSQYLFVSESGEKPYRGTKAIKDYAVKAKVSDTCLFTATHLRKQLATLSQAMAISKFNQDQLATFLGHDIRVHRGIYRQPLEVIEKSKVASFLFRVNKGISVNLKDLPSNEDEDIDVDSSDSEEEKSIEGSKQKSQEDSQTCNKRVSPQGSQKKTLQIERRYTKKTRRTVQKRRDWTKEEKNAVHRQLAHCITMNRIPKKEDAESALEAEPVALRHRSWKDIKYWVYNYLKTN
ncbi:uncharacterized protein [Littorina saxatilis]|uniref:uncharacterized protein isoform X1 n=2 Tax=Littorina saxatilis TaxID=31220 RepID=UPI0038B61A57